MRTAYLSLSIVAVIACVTAEQCHARAWQSPERGEVRRSAEPSAANSEVPSTASEEEIVVIGKRWGQAEIASETEVGEDEIAAYGADTIQDLVQGIAPLIGGNGDTPAILVNGRRIGSPEEITGYPTEALKRVAILPPRAAAHYGFPAGQRVVNLELKKHYASWDANSVVTVPTAGGRRSVQVSAGRTAIDANTRWNVQIATSDETMLLKSARHVPVSGNILPLLPTLQGQPVDPNRFESILGEVRSLNFNAGVTHPVGALSASLSFNAGTNRGRQLTGLPLGTITLPPGSPWVPATGAPVITSRLLDGRALQSRQQSESFGLSASLSGQVLGWQTDVSAFYSHSRSDNIYDRGYDVMAVQDLVDLGDPTFDPFGSWPGTPLRADRARFRTDRFGATFNASKSVLTLPAGDLYTSITVNAHRNRARQTFVEGGSLATRRERSGSDEMNARWSLSLPVTNQAMDSPLAALGDIAMDVSLEVGGATRTRTRHKWNAGVRWLPFPALDLRVAMSGETTEPTFEQLYGPPIEIVTRMFDFLQQAYVQPVQVFGGNPGLDGGSIRNLAIDAMVRPFESDLATLNFGYARQISRGGITSFPALTPEIEAAFPGRVTRDADSSLVAIDARPINIAYDRTEAITSGLTLRYVEKPDRPEGEVAEPNAFTPWTASLSLIHNWQLSSETVIREGLPVLDRLRSSGQPRHTIALNLVLGRRGLGVSLNGNWSSAAQVASGEGTNDVTFRYSPTVLFNLGLFAEPEHWGEGGGEGTWTSGLRISLDVQNLLNGYRKMSALGQDSFRTYGRDEVDPLGRTIRLSVRKQF
ncbi:porin family protein [Pelagerythrobacter aerophilus]|uniref:Uncharacterized protein n=1 Tax=Pelagerythrobacter aerophilus TaxID=2306995 RepID=A0A418NJ08_9SPHN|nr:TonB-dependent receptor [Pelagerythrobacter aerophilus]RIV79189.1 hypothetical protein D2V04_04025 [Pelagerythrobacter aerophilus]